MSKTLMKGILVVIALVVTALYFVYNKPHRNILKEEATFSLPLTKMNEEFLADEELAFEKYFNEVVEISGTAVSIAEKAEGRFDVVLQSHGITANGELIQPDVNTSTLIDQEVLLKGLFIGYDNLLEEIKLSECSIKQLSTK